jgi:hypothetical protein
MADFVCRAQAQLHSHPHSPCPAVQAIGASVEQVNEVTLRLVYTLAADCSLLVIPEPKAAVRADGLWKHTCFELFMRRAGEPGYVEYNFSPSGAWAAYRFRGYRELAEDQDNHPVPELNVVRAPGQLEMVVTLDLKQALPHNGQLQLGLAAVIEASDGGLSYWAQKHATDKPDFHHPDSFVHEPDPGRTRKT